MSCNCLIPPRIFLRCIAMTFCCSTEQWFSNDRITGYLHQPVTYSSDFWAHHKYFIPHCIVQVNTVYDQVNWNMLFILGNTERIVLDAANDVLEVNLGRERVSVIDDWFIVGSVPAVHCHNRHYTKTTRPTNRVGKTNTPGGGGNSITLRELMILITLFHLSIRIRILCPICLR